MKKIICALFACLLLCNSAPVMAISAASYIVTDCDTGEILYGQNYDRKMLIASTTKIMTAIIALENGSLTDIVTIPKEAVNVEGSSMYLHAGDKITLEELLYGMMLASGNDAATAVAIHIAGGVKNFAAMMNEKARELGAYNTSFANPHGIDAEGHYSTAEDMAIIAAYAMKNEDFAKIVSTRQRTIDGKSYVNHNRLLGSCEGVIGVKTGYTMAAGRALVSCCERDGMRLICVTLNDPNDWDDHSELYDKAYSEYKRVIIADSETDYAVLPLVSAGDRDRIAVRAQESVSVLVKRDDELKIEAELPRFAYAATTEGEQIGTLTWSINGEKVGSVPLVFTETIVGDTPEDKGFFGKFTDFVEYYMNRFGFYGS